MMGKIRIIFDGPPGPDGGRFIEVEGESGESINIGEWIECGSYWHLEIEDYFSTIAALKAKVEWLKTMSTVEMMCENKNVKHHITEWENRCLKAEAEAVWYGHE